MRKIVIVWLVVSILAACCPCRHLTSASTADSVRVETIVRTEFVKDTVYMEVPREVVREVAADSSHLETEYARSHARILTDGRLFHSLENKAQKRPVEVQSRIEYRDSIVYRDRTVNNIVEVEKQLTAWQRFQMSGFWTLAAVALCIVLRHIKKYFIL